MHGPTPFGDVSLIVNMNKPDFAALEANDQA
jgi:hypothetical protein